MSPNKEIELDQLASVLSDDLPGDVSTHEQLSLLPEEYLNINDRRRPLLHTDIHGNSYTYSLNPLGIILILLLELLERFSFYGLYMSQTNYLTGSYDEDWNAGISSMEAASLVSLSTAIAYTVPFLGGILADKYLGDYKTILLGTLMFYLPGLFLIASSTTPNWWLGKDEFNVKAYKMALLFFWPVGTGIMKSVVNIFGARQFHPVLQRSMIESFYVRFYMVINVGAVAGCIIIPVVARSNITLAYTIPFILLFVAIVTFMMGSSRYVIVVPGKKDSELQAHTGSQEELSKKDAASFIDVAKICMLIVPFNIVYSQCATTFMVQGAVMEPYLGFIEAPNLNILDCVSVLLSGYIVSTYLYPYLANHNIKLPTAMKFALGSAFGSLAIFWSILVEHMIHSVYAKSGGEISVMWQAPSYVLIGAGEIFSISTAYEVAFTASPPDKKAFACAFNLFCIGGIPNVLSLCLFRLCEKWFQNASGSGNIRMINDYTEAHVNNYFSVLLATSFFGVVINILPSIVSWVSSVEKKAAEASMANTPRPTPKASRENKDGWKESDPLLSANRHRKYLEQAKGPSIYRMNTMKAKFSKSQREKKVPVK